MFSALRRVFRPNAQVRRVLSGLCAAFALATIAFSSIFISADADHDCLGHDCQICQEMQTCVENFELVGSATPAGGDCPSPRPSAYPVETVPCVRSAPATTLRSLDVRFDE